VKIITKQDKADKVRFKGSMTKWSIQNPNTAQQDTYKANRNLNINWSFIPHLILTMTYPNLASLHIFIHV